MNTLTDNEKAIIDLLRSLQPFEQVTIGADKSGKPNNFFLQKSRKGIINDQGLTYLSI